MPIKAMATTAEMPRMVSFASHVAFVEATMTLIGSMVLLVVVRGAHENSSKMADRENGESIAGSPRELVVLGRCS